MQWHFSLHILYAAQQVDSSQVHDVKHRDYEFVHKITNSPMHRTELHPSGSNCISQRPFACISIRLTITKGNIATNGNRTDKRPGQMSLLFIYSKLKPVFAEVNISSNVCGQQTAVIWE